MLNMKYLIYNKDTEPLLNPYHNGNAWFVNNIVFAANANEEMKVVGEIDTKHELVVDKTFTKDISLPTIIDSTAQISLKSYQPNLLKYDFQSKSDQLAVFSEIYYDKGWNAYINGERANYFRANYLLRAMYLKQGNYEIVFKFEPNSYRIGNTIAISSSILLILALLAFAFIQFKKSNNKKTEKSI